MGLVLTWISSLMAVCHISMAFDWCSIADRQSLEPIESKFVQKQSHLNFVDLVYTDGTRLLRMVFWFSKFLSHTQVICQLYLFQVVLVASKVSSSDQFISLLIVRLPRPYFDFAASVYSQKSWYVIYFPCCLIHLTL